MKNLKIPTFIACVFLFYNAKAQNCMSIAGSTGIVDETSIGKLKLGRISYLNLPPDTTLKYKFEDMAVHIDGRAGAGNYSIRYPIPFSKKDFEFAKGFRFQATLKVSDPTLDKITIYLKEWDGQSNFVKIVSVISTNTLLEKDKYVILSQDVYTRFDPLSKTYFVEAILTTKRPSISATNKDAVTRQKIEGPIIGSIAICDTP